MYATIEQANAAVIARIREARPHWQDVDLAHRLIPQLAEGRKLLPARRSHGRDERPRCAAPASVPVRRLGAG